jgi:hypothetical protein
MSELDYDLEPEVGCPNDDPNNVAFVRETSTIRGCNVVEEYVECKMYLLAAGFGFENMSLGMTPVSKVETPLPLFAVGIVVVGHADKVLVEIETEAKRVLGSFGLREYDALEMVNIPNGCWLNRGLEQMAVPYTPRPLPGSDVSQVANKKRKAEVSKKPSAKRVKAGPSQALQSTTVPPPPKTGLAKKIGVLKISRSNVKSGP